MKHWKSTISFTTNNNMGRIKSLLMDAEENGFSFMSKGEKSACPNHFEDQYLIKTLRKKEEDGVCSYCGVHGKVVDLSYIANHIAFVLSLNSATL